MSLRAEKTGYNYWTVTDGHQTWTVIRERRSWLIQSYDGPAQPLAGAMAVPVLAAIGAAR